VQPVIARLLPNLTHTSRKPDAPFAAVTATAPEKMQDALTELKEGRSQISSANIEFRKWCIIVDIFADI
jgi:hypothetical protein